MPFIEQSNLYYIDHLISDSEMITNILWQFDISDFIFILCKESGRLSSNGRLYTLVGETQYQKFGIHRLHF